MQVYVLCVFELRKDEVIHGARQDMQVESLGWVPDLQASLDSSSYSRSEMQGCCLSNPTVYGNPLQEEEKSVFLEKHIKSVRIEIHFKIIL